MDLVPAFMAFIDGLGGPEMLLIFVIILMLFGGKKLPEFARGLGKSMREFKKAAAGVEEEFKRALEEDERSKYTPPPAPALNAPATNPSPTDGTTETDYSDPYHDGYGDSVPADPVPESTAAAAATVATAEGGAAATSSTEGVVTTPTAADGTEPNKADVGTPASEEGGPVLAATDSPGPVASSPEGISPADAVTAPAPVPDLPETVAAAAKPAEETDPTKPRPASGQPGTAATPPLPS